MHDVIARQMAQLSRLVDDLLDVSRINLGKLELRLESLDLGADALQALDVSRPLLTERNHKVSVDLPAEPVRVGGDALRLTQVISNILNNAAKYTDPSGQVRLSLRRPRGRGHRHRLRHRHRDPRGSARARVRPLRAGTGGARAIERRSRHRPDPGQASGRMHGGYVRVSSPGEGRGSEFVVSFPLLDDALPAQTVCPLPVSPDAIAPASLVALSSVSSEGWRGGGSPEPTLPFDRRGR